MEQPKVKVLYFGPENPEFVNKALAERTKIEAVYCVQEFSKVEGVIREHGIQLMLFCSSGDHAQDLEDLGEKMQIPYAYFSRLEPREFDISFAFTIGYVHDILGWAGP